LQRFYKKAAAFVLRAVAKHSPELAQSVVDCGALDALVICLEEFDPGVKEAAAWALGYIARHNNGNLSQIRLLCNFVSLRHSYRIIIMILTQ
jgi:Armadillo/beta-catenin-like repeat